jgi:glycogen operon protein
MSFAIRRRLHRAGIEVILDASSTIVRKAIANGPTLCFRGFDNSTYYICEHARAMNYSGTGNTLTPIIPRAA